MARWYICSVLLLDNRWSEHCEINLETSPQWNFRVFIFWMHCLQVLDLHTAIWLSKASRILVLALSVLVKQDFADQWETITTYQSEFDFFAPLRRFWFWLVRNEKWVVCRSGKYILREHRAGNEQDLEAFGGQTIQKWPPRNTATNWQNLRQNLSLS